MVISSSNRSPSPMRSNPNPNSSNSNSRNNQEREASVGVRKSFSGYPFAKSSIISQPKSFTPNTPVNSPAEYARRSSFGRECGVTFGEHDQKENERDPNSKPVAKVRSPSISKGCKHFMSPTISAASKINPSPRKKVLGERNEAIRTSASLSDGKFHFFSSSSLEFADENESKQGMETPPPCSTMLDFNNMNNEASNIELEKKVSELSPGVGNIALESDLVVLSPEVPFSNNTSTKSPETLPQSVMPKIVVVEKSDVSLDNKKTIDSSPSMVIAPLDADPCYQPYDPKTNFLSPRPRFLHYKPNPRIESYISQGLRLEDDFTSESVSETEASEEAQSDETSSSAETSSVEEPLPSSGLSSPKCQQPEEIVEAVIEPSSPEEPVEAVVEPRSWIGGKWRIGTMFLIILLGSISFAMYSPGVGNAIHQNKIISQVFINSQVAADLAKESVKSLVKNGKVWSDQSVSYLSHVIYKRSEVKFSPLPLSNLTVWQEEEVGDYGVQGFDLWRYGRKEDGFDTGIGKVTEIETGKHLETVKHKSFAEETELIKPVTDQVVEDSEPATLLENYVFEDVLSAVEMSELPSVVDEAENQESEPEHQEYDVVSGSLHLTEEVMEGSEPESQEETSMLQDTVIEDVYSVVDTSEQPSLFDEPEVQESEQPSLVDEPEVRESEQVHEEYVTASAVQYESQSEFKAEEDSEVHPQVTTANELFDEAVEIESSEGSLAPVIAAVSLVVMSLLAAAPFMSVKKPKNKTPVVSTPLPQHFVKEEKSACMPAASNINSKVHVNPSCSSPVEVDMLSESCCPSEMSSIQKASSYHNKRGHDEAQSEEKSSKRNYNKRESLASSSTEYTMTSSYGSFTTYSIMHSKNRDDEVVTPVRRSSRIRSKVTSP